MAARNWNNQTVWTGDNLDIMRGMNSACVDLIYLDPPFNSKADYAAPIGSLAAGAAFKDTWGLDDINLAWHGEIKHEHPGLYALLQATREIHGDSMMSYLIYMAIRLMEMRRLLKPTGSLYLHCNQEAGHYLKLLLDSLFGRGNFINEIVWNYGTPSGGRAGGRKPVKAHDTLLAYASGYGKHVYNRQFTPYGEKYVRDWFRHRDDAGRAYRTRKRKGAIVRQYLDESPGIPLSTVWSDIMQIYGSRGWFPTAKSEGVGYPTQKPVNLIRRIVRASSNPGETVLDPFCGCATACVAAELEHREWAGIDISAKAAELVKDRMESELRLFFAGAHRTDVPERTDLGNVIPYNDTRNKKFLYGEQGGFCNGCEAHFRMRNLTVDHIIPKSRGGTDHISNLQLLCGHCNSVKGNRPQEYLLACLTDKGWIKKKMAA